MTRFADRMTMKSSLLTSIIASMQTSLQKQAALSNS